MIAFEGNYIHEEAVSNDLIRFSLQDLLKLLRLEESGDYEAFNMEISHKNYKNKDFQNYIRINDSSMIKSFIGKAIESSFEKIKSESFAYPYQLYISINAIVKPTSSDIEFLLLDAGYINPKRFNTHLFYSICFVLKSYLNVNSDLNPENVFLTEDQARVIYYTCKIHGLLNVSHDLERDGLNYIRMVLNNNRHHEPMIGTIKDFTP